MNVKMQREGIYWRYIRFVLMLPKHEKDLLDKIQVGRIPKMLTFAVEKYSANRCKGEVWNQKLQFISSLIFGFLCCSMTSIFRWL